MGDFAANANLEPRDKKPTDEKEQFEQADSCPRRQLQATAAAAAKAVQGDGSEADHDQGGPPPPHDGGGHLLVVEEDNGSKPDSCKREKISTSGSGPAAAGDAIGTGGIRLDSVGARTGSSTASSADRNANSRDHRRDVQVSSSSRSSRARRACPPRAGRPSAVVETGDLTSDHKIVGDVSHHLETGRVHREKCRMNVGPVSSSIASSGQTRAPAAGQLGVKVGGSKEEEEVLVVLSKGEKVVVVDNMEKLGRLLTVLKSLRPADRRIYLDFEGIRLCRNGRLCIGQLTFPHPERRVYLLDFVAMPNILSTLPSPKRAADSVDKSDLPTPLSAKRADAKAVEADSFTLRSVLRSADFVKFFFDPRNDVDAMYHQCGGIMPVNVVCLQLCELAKDRQCGGIRSKVNGLARALSAVLPFSEQLRSTNAKNKGKNLFAPECGGTYEVFARRPLHPDIIEYAATDVLYMPSLEKDFWTPLSDDWKAWVKRESEKRVSMCLRPSHWGCGPQNANAPN
ncbi:hypothetical protein CBR_g41171 [Chara braunii]|uniref:3'-5' exonuclease domain-containing protein n=1 Tax=Chara braunii TaxID=69332 RepID=A0A388K2G4_CHABU|nr:hypothetical protein CBR_g41171 [Chara braunii]|eukprot:GBG64251.1 hypothetical protein CBR_g41171 [Chara braunii]